MERQEWRGVQYPFVLLPLSCPRSSFSVPAIDDICSDRRLALPVRCGQVHMLRPAYGGPGSVHSKYVFRVAFLGVRDTSTLQMASAAVRSGYMPKKEADDEEA